MRYYLPEGGVGDALALTATLREHHKTFPHEPLYVSTSHRYDDVFKGNPHLSIEPVDARCVVLETELHGDVGNIAVSFGLQAGIEVRDHTPEVYLSAVELARAPTFTGDVVAVDPWARSSTRRWSMDRWSELCRLLRRAGFTVVSIGKRIADYVTRKVDNTRLPVDVDLTGKLSLRETFALLRGVDLYVGTDSGGTHMAAACGTPQVCLYSRSPWYSRAYWNTTPVYAGAHPCHKALCNRECGNPFGFCLDDVSVSAMLEAVHMAFKRFPRRKHGAQAS